MREIVEGSAAVSGVGRDRYVHRVLGALAVGRRVLLHGPAGIGKTTLADTVADHSRAAGARVLRSAPAEAESDLPYLVLIDLFAQAADASADLPPHLRDALDAALLRRRGGARPDELTVRLAVLELLRRLAADAPVLVIVDDVQWADRPGIDVLDFAARRLHGGRVGFLATERVAPGAARTGRLRSGPAETIAVEPLTAEETGALLAGLGAFGPAAVERVHRASGGNPMYAIELCRALGDAPAPSAYEPLPVPDSLRGLLTRSLDGLDPAARRALLVCALAARPSTELLHRCRAMPPGGLGPAEDARVITVGDLGEIAFRHPLLRELVPGDAGGSARRAAHALLAAAVDEPVERARHRALGSPEVDEDTAALAEAAGAEAAGRGAPGTACDLLRLAAGRTPPEDTEAVAERLLTAARHASDAGRHAEATELAEAALSAGGSAGTRVGARLLLIDLAGPDLTGADAHVEAAEADAGGHTALESRVCLVRASLAYFARRHDDAARYARRAERLARGADDPELMVEALSMRATAAISAGDPDADAFHRAAYRYADGLPLSPATADARQMWAMTALFRGDLDTAVEAIARLEADVRARGLVSVLMSVLISAGSIRARAGHGPAALAAGRECLRLFQDAAPTAEVGLVVAAGAENFAGSAAAALDLATRAIAQCEANGDDEWLEPAAVTHGQALLLAGDPSAAVASFDRAAVLEARSGSRDPAIIPWHADHAEALIAAGRHDDARRALDVLDERAELFGRTVVRLPARRARALLAAAEGDRDALPALREAIAADGPHAYPLDVARAELAAGRIARRFRRRAAARTAFAAAAEEFRRIGAVPHLAVARAELDRLDETARPQAGALSEIDRRLVGLVREGLTNKEIAAALYLSVKAVEARLSRLYRRFGVRNRAALLGRMGQG